MTDLYLLIFLPVSVNKNLGKLLYYFDLRKISVNYNDHSVEIIQDSRSLICNENLKFFSLNIKFRIKQLKLKYNFYEPDNNKLYFDPFFKYNYDELKEFIRFKEKYKTYENIRDLIQLYQRMVELLSSDNNNNYFKYLDKIKEAFIKLNKQSKGFNIELMVNQYRKIKSANIYNSIITFSIFD